MSNALVLVYFRKTLRFEFTYNKTALAADKRAWMLKTLFFAALDSGFTRSCKTVVLHLLHVSLKVFVKSKICCLEIFIDLLKVLGQDSDSFTLSMRTAF